MDEVKTGKAEDEEKPFWRAGKGRGIDGGGRLHYTGFETGKREKLTRGGNQKKQRGREKDGKASEL